MVYEHMRVCCVCHGGNNRSGAMSYILKHGDFGHHDAVPIGCDTAGLTIKELLFSWCDRIVVMQPEIAKTIPPRYAMKVRVCDVGADVYHNNKHPFLWKKINEWLQRGGLN